jgi:hypothetical protein
MELDTSSLESSRKNLVVLSMGFILFAIGNATLGDSSGATSLSFLSGSITFKNPDALVYFAWTMFGWFLLRFWQFSSHRDDWASYTQTMNKTKLFNILIKSKTQVKGHAMDGSYQPILGDWTFPEKMAQSSQSKYIIKNNEYFKKIAFFLWVAVTTEKFGQHYFPYCLVIIAVTVTLCY